MNLQEAHQLVQSGKALLVDVRELAELRETGVIEGALWMPSSKIAEDPEEWDKFRQGLPRDKTVFIYCRSGNRSGRITEILCQMGVQAENLGGFAQCQCAGLPVKSFKG